MMYQKMMACHVGSSLDQVAVIGVNHKRADFAFREKIARISEKIVAREMKEREWILLSTCNRTEIYFYNDNNLLSFLLQALAQEGFQDSSFFYFLFGIDCFIHLSKVTAGLDSAMIGESQIQHQVKMAYKKALLEKKMSKPFHYLFQKALRVGKMARSFGPWSQDSNELLWKIAEKVPFAKKRVLFVGNSSINRSFARFLENRGDFEIAFITNHPEKFSLEKVATFSRDHIDLWKQFDWIIVATKSLDYLISGVGRKDQLIFDLSVPRNVDPEIEGPILWNMEMMEKVLQDEEKRFSSSIGLEEFVENYARRLAFLYEEKELKILHGWEILGRGSRL